MIKGMGFKQLVVTLVGAVVGVLLAHTYVVSKYDLIAPWDNVAYVVAFILCAYVIRRGLIWLIT